VQVLGGLFNVLVRKGRKSRSDARDALLSWRDTFAVIQTSPEGMPAAADLAPNHQHALLDAILEGDGE
jgi:predicted nucleic acid-binding protein